MVIRVIGKKTGGVNMIKKVISVVIAICLMFISTIGSSIQPIYAASSARINPDDMLTVLNDITVAGQSWENIGFDSEDIANIMQMQRKDDSYYASLNTDIARLSVETVETKALENAIAGQGYIQSYAQNGNPPATPQEQNERMQYVTQVALERYGNTYNTADFNKYVLYLYMSHYIDNPNYTKESPGFDNIYAYVITSDDITAYENFIAQSKFSMFSTNLVNFMDEFKSAVNNSSDILTAVDEGKVISINTANAIYGLSTFNPEKTASRAKLIVTSFKDHYESTASVNELLNAMYVDLEPEDVSQQYIDACVTGFLGVLAGTTLFGFGMSISLCYYNVYANLYDKAKLTALHYSLSGRVAIRLDELIGG